MGAETTIYCKVMVAKYEWITLNAVTLDEAIKKAESMPNVIKCLEASYIPGGVIT